MVIEKVINLYKMITIHYYIRRNIPQGVPLARSFCPYWVYKAIPTLYC